ncbi:M56 family metallopeptidase [Lutibacter sp.]
MINYILQVLLFQAVFLAVYDLFLQKETFFRWNRFYLLVTPVLSFIIPLLKSKTIQKTIPQEYIEQLPTVFLNPQEVITQVSVHNSYNYLEIIFYVGLVFFTGLFLLKLLKIFKLIASNKVIKKERYSLVLLQNRQAAFSFLRYIFINEHLLKNRDLQIIKHELIHCEEGHTLDLLFFELLKIVLWFNPLVYVYQKRITLLHEYISDAKVVLETDKKNYFNKLLAETFNVENITFINQFYKHSLIKKRIVMITKNKSKKVKQLKYLLILPLLIGMLVYTSCTNDTETEFSQIEKAIQNDNVSSEGRYFEGPNGFKIFVGKSFEGEKVAFEDMTENEKVMVNKFSQIEKKGKYTNGIQLMIDSNGDKVWFIEVENYKPRSKDITTIETEAVPFMVVEEVPVFPGCEGTKEQLKKCLQENITKFVSENFNVALAQELNLNAGVNRIYVMFDIGKNGMVENVKARAPHKKLQEEAVRVVKSLPTMLPGKQKGKPVSVTYSLPIAFKID